MLQDTPRIRVVLDMERLLGAGDWDSASAHFTDTVTYKVGAQPVRTGIEGIKSYMNEQSRFARWTGHDPKLMLETDETVIIEVDSHFFLLANQQDITLPCTDIYRFDGMKITDWRVYADLSVFGDAG